MNRILSMEAREDGSVTITTADRFPYVRGDTLAVSGFSRPLRVVATTATTLTCRKLRWYESAWDWARSRVIDAWRWASSMVMIP